MDDLSKLSHMDLLFLLTRKANAKAEELPEISECLARMASTEPDWQLIETAPSGRSCEDEILVGRYVGAGWRYITCVFDIALVTIEGITPTHWAPRPKGPADG